MKRRWKRIGLVAAVVVAAGATLLAVRPSRAVVDAAPVTRGPLRVTVDEDGETRVRDHHDVAAPVAGRLEPIALDEGDSVVRGQVVARLHPVPLDPRLIEQGQARLRAAEEMQREAEARVDQARASLEETRRNVGRLQQLLRTGSVPQRDVDQARTAERTGASELAAAEHRARAATFEVRTARAALAGAGTERPGDVVLLRSPVSGVLLRVYQEHDRVVPAGALLLEVGDPKSLEVVADILSDDALEVRPGAEMLVHAGASADTLRARVRRVEPAAFTKVSPLGVEEQRVNVVGDLLAAPPGLGDGFRVDVKVIIWQADDVLRVPASALFRAGAEWRVFVVEAGRVWSRPVRVAHRGDAGVEILDGLAEGQVVVLHPGDRVEDGARVQVRRPR